MSLDLEEQEKLDTLKDYWNSYGNLVVGALAAVAITFAGVQWWQHNQQQKSAEASALFTALQNAQKTNQTQIVTDTAKTLTGQYASTAYAARGALIAAASNVQANDVKTAKAELQWVIDNSKEDGIKALATLQMAGILLDENNPSAALALLDAPHEEAFADLFSDRKGDALVMQNKQGEARKAYKIALEKLPAGSPYRKVIEIKLNAIAGVSTK
ncbi:YfgM family protein [Sulfuriferula thiophila]|uniref:YfgM family protein n=1 Tax=Sulfuriferula thiophila TaxID=1781211 RepID=UPI000F6071FB|nr:tetratricopeptide repeat protein [Sulfuriferula thiophila]